MRIIHSHVHSNKADMIRVIMTAKLYSGNHVDLKFPDICLTGEEKNPKKNLAQETCPDRGSNPGPLRSCYRLLNSFISSMLKQCNIYSRGLKILQVIYESFDCDLTQEFFIRGFNR